MTDIHDQSTPIGEGAVLRWGTNADAHGYAALAAHAFVIGPDAHPNPNVASYAHDLMGNTHPLCKSSDIALVSRHDTIVAAAALMTQPMRYGGVALPVGRPELVCSHQSVRQQGYVRAIMERMHAKSAARGDLLQVITGIPHYYHQFGYAWSIDYNGYARIETAALPELDAAHPHVTIRPFARHEYSVFNELYEDELASRGLVVTTPYPEALFVHGIETTVSTEGFRPCGIYDEHNQIIGFCILTVRIWEGFSAVMALGFTKYARALTHLVPTLHAIHAINQSLPKPVASHRDYFAIDILTDGAHPITSTLTVLGIASKTIAPYTWYVRIPDVPRLLMHVRNVLEVRLAASGLSGYTGVIEITFYRHGIRMDWRNGVLTSVTTRTAAVYGDAPHAGYPLAAFTQQFCGWRSFSELRSWYPDVWATPATRVLLDILFPKSASQLLWMN